MKIRDIFKTGEELQANLLGEVTMSKKQLYLKTLSQTKGAWGKLTKDEQDLDRVRKKIELARTAKLRRGW